MPINGANAQNYEMANYTVVDGTHLQMTLNKAHRCAATVAIGGLCGYGLEQTVDTAKGIRQVFPVVGSYSATGLYYAGGATAIVGVMGHDLGLPERDAECGFDSAQQQCCDGDDCGKSAGGCEWPDADGRGSGRLAATTAATR